MPPEHKAINAAIDMLKSGGYSWGGGWGWTPAVHPSLEGGRDVVSAICLDRRQHDDQKTRPTQG
jgi:hypothetical protein